LELSRWDDLNAFAVRNNLAVLFGVNALYGRNLPGPCPEGTNCRFKDAGTSYDPCCTNWTGYWDSSNFESLLRYSADKGYSFYALEFGNELVGSKGIESHISVEDYVHDWTRFVGLIAEVYGSNETLTPPKIVVPDTTWMSDWFGEFLTAICSGTDTSLVPDIVTHHLYSLGSGQDTAAVSQKSLNATYLDQIW
jgi:heparanase